MTSRGWANVAGTSSCERRKTSVCHEGLIEVQPDWGRCAGRQATTRCHASSRCGNRATWMTSAATSKPHTGCRLLPPRPIHPLRHHHCNIHCRRHTTTTIHTTYVHEDGLRNAGPRRCTLLCKHNIMFGQLASRRDCFEKESHLLIRTDIRLCHKPVVWPGTDSPGGKSIAVAETNCCRSLGPAPRGGVSGGGGALAQADVGHKNRHLRCCRSLCTATLTQLSLSKGGPLHPPPLLCMREHMHESAHLHVRPRSLCG